MAGPSTADTPSLLRAFWTGLTTPDVRALGIALLLVIVGFAGATVLITSERMAGPSARLWLRSAGDHDVIVSSDMLRLRAHMPGGAVLITGASPTRNAVDTHILSTELTPPRPVFGLMQSAQQPLSTALLTHFMPERIDGWVVFGVTPARLLEDPKRGLEQERGSQRLALRRPRDRHVLAELGIDAGPMTGNYFWDNRAFFGPRVRALLANVIRGHAPHHLAIPHVDGERAQGLRTWQRNRRLHELRYLGFAGLAPAARAVSFAANLRFLERAAATVRARGGRVAFMIEPVNPAFVEAIGLTEWLASERAQLRAALRPIAPVLDPGADVTLRGEDFVDHVHVGSRAACTAFTQALARQLAARIAAEAER